MFGVFLDGLTGATTAEATATSVARPEILARIRTAAEASATPAGILIAARVRQVVEHGGWDIWLDLLSQMAGPQQPGAVALELVLAYAFPDPVRVNA